MRYGPRSAIAAGSSADRTERLRAWDSRDRLFIPGWRSSGFPGRLPSKRVISSFGSPGFGDDLVADCLGEEVVGDDLDAAPVHLGEQRLSERIDVVEVNEVDPQSRLLRFGADRVPQQPKLADPAT